MKPERFAEYLERFEEDVHDISVLKSVAGSMANAIVLANDDRLHDWQEICCEKNPENATSSIVQSMTFFLRKTIEETLLNIQQHGAVIGLRTHSPLTAPNDLYDTVQETTADTYAAWLGTLAQTTSTVIFQNRSKEMVDYEIICKHITTRDSLPGLRGFRHVAEVCRTILSIAGTKIDCLISPAYSDVELRTNTMLGAVLRETNDVEMNPHVDRIADFTNKHEGRDGTALRELLLRKWVSYDAQKTPPYQLTEIGDEALNYVMLHNL